jgi:glycosyltransferase involved in cell wall biosynthesis
VSDAYQILRLARDDFMMVSVALEHRFLRLPDGSVWTQSQCAWPFWSRYLDVFDRVRCVARVHDVSRLDGEWHRADGRDVSFAAVPHFIGPMEFVRRFRKVRAAVYRSLRIGDAVVLRVPGTLGHLAFRRLTAGRYPFGVEVVADPHDVFAPGAVRHPLRPFLRWHMARQLRRQCREACAASYVTAGALQRRYPPTAYTINASSIDLAEGAFAATPRVFEPHTGPVHLVFVGSLEQLYKAPDLLIRAVAACAQDGRDVRLRIVGDGARRRQLESLASAAGVENRVCFVGQLPSTAVRAELDQADLFVLPSRTEGLPRAMIEAMARGLPCIGSDIGGIPELLHSDALVPCGDLQVLSAKIRHVIGDAAWMTRMSACNLATARRYSASVLQQRRVGFYRRIREATEEWLRERGKGDRGRTL